MTEKREFLAQLPIFAGLSEAAVDAIARITKEYAFDEGAVIAYQRDVANHLFIVKEGRLFARSIDNNGVPRETKSYFPSQYFRDEWLFLPGIHTATVKGAEAGQLYIIEGPLFVQLLRNYPAIIDALAPDDDGEIRYGLSDAAWNEAQKLKLKQKVRSSSIGALLHDETLELFTRRSRWFLLGTLLPPILILMVAAVLLILIPTSSPLWSVLKVGLPLLIALVGLIIMVLRLIDFREDYFIITNRHLTHHEFELRLFRIHLIKIPIGQIQTVEILKPSLWATLFNIGSARVTTAAVAGNILFDNIDNPSAVKDTLERLSGQNKELETAQTQESIRRSMERHFGMEPHLTPAGDDEEEQPVVGPRKKRLMGFRRRFGWRVVDGNTITYRKSFFVLLKRIALPLLGFVVIGLLAGLAMTLNLPTRISLTIIGLLGIANFIGFIWQLEDWRNDIFQLTDRFVLDIDRKPFGFGESRRQASIANIQNVDASRPGLLPTLLNYGFVSIDTAGAQTDIVFDYVPNPELVQSDIFQRIDEAAQQRRIQEGSTRRQEYGMLLDVYQQAMEQKRIPQRTPSGVPTNLEDT